VPLSQVSAAGNGHLLLLFGAVGVTCGLLQQGQAMRSSN
jgi:hypothetical protein